MRDINNLALSGRLTRDSEIRYTNAGLAVCTFSIAVNRSKKQGDQWVDEANFFDVVIYGKFAEAMEKHLSKGVQVFIDGELKQDRWEQDGQKRSKVSIICSSLVLGSRPVGQPNRPQTSEADYPNPEDFDDDIPF